MRSLLVLVLILSSLNAFAEVGCDDIFPIKRPKFYVPKDYETLLVVGQDREKKLRPNKAFSVLVWNIYKARGKGFHNDFKYLQKKADFTLLQETVFNLNNCGIYKGFEQNEWITALSFWTEPTSATGVTTGSRYYTSEIDFLRSPDREPIIRTPKMATYTKYPLQSSEKELLIVNLHGINVTPDHYLRNQLRAVQSRVSHHDGPLIVAGDFNTRNSSRILYLREFANNLDLDILKMDNDNRKSRLDHILARGLMVHRATILEKIKSSDHPALWAELEIND
jgi:endonuclease/exonuclease/phosphatase (EEP) superfamily protein YafD